MYLYSIYDATYELEYFKMESSLSLAALIVTAILTAVIHTLSGPDHYLPFIAIARSRHYGYGKAFFWTFLCGLGHIGSA